MAQVRVSHRMDHSDGQPSPNYFPGGGLGFGSKRFDKRRVRAWTRLSSHPLKAFGIILGILFVVLLGILVAVDWSYFLPLDPDPAATALAASGHTVAPLVGPALASAKAAEMAKKYTVRINTFRRNDLLKQVTKRCVKFFTSRILIPLESFNLESTQNYNRFFFTCIIYTRRRSCHST